MKRLCCFLVVVFSLFGFIVVSGNRALAQSGPPAVKVSVTIVNKCTWQVPVRLGKSKYSFWTSDFDDLTADTGWVVLEPSKSDSYSIDKGVGDWFFFVKNTTNNTYKHNSRPYEFSKNTTITVKWIDDDYDWSIEKEK
jgi:hypothetical protein